MGVWNIITCACGGGYTGEARLESPGGELFGVIMTGSVGDLQTFQMSSQRTQVVTDPLVTAQPRVVKKQMTVEVIP